MKISKWIPCLAFGFIAVGMGGSAEARLIITMDDSTDTVIGRMQTDTGTFGCKFGGDFTEPGACQMDLPDDSLPLPNPNGKDFVEVVFTEGANSQVVSDVFFLGLAGGGRPPSIIFQSDCNGV